MRILDGGSDQVLGDLGTVLDVRLEDPLVGQDVAGVVHHPLQGKLEVHPLPEDALPLLAHQGGHLDHVRKEAVRLMETHRVVFELGGFGWPHGP